MHVSVRTSLLVATHGLPPVVALRVTANIACLVTPDVPHVALHALHTDQPPKQSKMGVSYKEIKREEGEIETIFINAERYEGYTT